MTTKKWIVIAVVVLVAAVAFGMFLPNSWTLIGKHTLPSGDGWEDYKIDAHRAVRVGIVVAGVLISTLATFVACRRRGARSV